MGKSNSNIRSTLTNSFLHLRIREKLSQNTVAFLVGISPKNRAHSLDRLFADAILGCLADVLDMWTELGQQVGKALNLLG